MTTEFKNDVHRMVGIGVVEMPCIRSQGPDRREDHGGKIIRDIWIS
jgi:hypothetical protein